MFLQVCTLLSFTSRLENMHLKCQTVEAYLTACFPILVFSSGVNCTYGLHSFKLPFNPSLVAIATSHCFWNNILYHFICPNDTCERYYPGWRVIKVGQNRSLYPTILQQRHHDQAVRIKNNNPSVSTRCKKFQFKFSRIKFSWKNLKIWKLKYLGYTVVVSKVVAGSFSLLCLHSPEP